MTHLIWKPKTLLNPLFSEWFQEPFAHSPSHRCALPAVNIRENEGGWSIELAVPGIPKDKIRIRLENRILTISAEQDEKSVEEKQQYHRREFGYVKFERAFSLPEGVDIENIEAKQEDGILEVFLPRVQTVKAEKQIAIR